MIKTTHILGIITIVDLIWGYSGGGLAMTLWVFYGVYKLLKYMIEND